MPADHDRGCESNTRAAAAVRTLEHYGFTHTGGAFWRPPLGAMPARFDPERQPYASGLATAVMPPVFHAQAPGELFAPSRGTGRWFDAACLVLLSHMLGPVTHAEDDKVAAFVRLSELGLVEKIRSSLSGPAGWQVTQQGAVAARALEAVMGICA